jgi:hypothetical protein
MEPGRVAESHEPISYGNYVAFYLGDGMFFGIIAGCSTLIRLPLIVVKITMHVVNIPTATSLCPQSEGNSVAARRLSMNGAER